MRSYRPPREGAATARKLIFVGSLIFIGRGRRRSILVVRRRSAKMPDPVRVQDDAAAVRAELFDGIASVRTFAQALGVTGRRVYQMIRSGEVSTVTIGGRSYVVTASARKAA
jgi:hypothetical protein